ncbi:MAG: co-chaperone GroES [Bdellovibrionales bacterium]|nr:co-chaperone GroES [Bdellovibrionales bacterium]
MAQIRPLHDRVIVQRLAEEERTRGGIIIPDTAKEKPQKGKVVSTGKGKITEDGKLLPLEVKPGDEVLFGKYAGTEFKVEGEEFLMMREDDIYGVINSGGKK